MRKTYKISSFILCLFCINTTVYSQIITTVAGGATGHGGYWGEGAAATAAQLNLFYGLFIDNDNNFYITDAGLDSRILKVDAISGIIHTIIGTGTAGYNGDGIPATIAQLNAPEAIAMDNFGNIYVYDYGNNRIRKIDGATGIISTYAGNGSFGSGGDGGPATDASIDGGAIAFDSEGNLYYTGTRKIRVITRDGMINTVIGNGLSGITGDGVPATATFIAPVKGIAFDRNDNMYIVDSTEAIRKITHATGIITRVAGTGDNLYAYSGDGIAATTCHIAAWGIAIDDTGNIYIADQSNSRIEKVDTFGIINTIAGTGIAGFSGDNGPAIDAKLSHPENLALDRCNNVYVGDFVNARLRKVTYHATCAITDSASLKTTTININNKVSVYPNPMHDEVNITGANKITEITITNPVGQCVHSQKYSNTSVRVDMQGLPAGVYVMKIIDETGLQTITNVIKE